MYREAIDQSLAQMSDEEIGHLADRVAEGLGLAVATPITKLELIVTEDCPFRCDYCFVEGKNPDNRLDLPTAQLGIDFLLDQSHQAERVEITLFGGEPLLEFPLLKDVIEYAERRAGEREKRLSWALTTNGLLMDDEKMAFFQAHRVPILLSIDGRRATHDAHRRLSDGSPTFDLVFPKIELMKRHQPWLGTRITFNPDTVHSLADDVRFLHQNGINQFMIGPNHDAPWTRAHVLEVYRDQLESLVHYYLEQRAAGVPLRMPVFERGLDELKEKYAAAFGCEAGRDKITVSARGRIFPCSKFNFLNNLDGTYCLGDLDRGLVATLERVELQDQRGTVRGRCFSCDCAPYCTGGCPAENLKRSGSIFIANETDCLFTRVWIDLHRSMPELCQTHKRPQREGPPQHIKRVA